MDIFRISASTHKQPFVDNGHIRIQTNENYQHSTLTSS